MSSIKCEKCGKEDVCYGMPSMYDPDYPVCYKCWCEWFYNGYHDIWFRIMHEDYGLANKFVLDFLGKLG